MPEPLPLNSPIAARRQFEQLEGQRRAIQQRREQNAKRLKEVAAYLELAPAVDDALEKLSEELFGKLAKMIETHLTVALQEVLGQPICLKIDRDYRRSAATMDFYIENAGRQEDIMRGQGGSVANILSVGLRIFALSQLDGKKHRRFLILDEQDCWLAPDLVPRLVKIVHDAGKALGFQTLMISHHGTGAFEQYADKIYRFSPAPEGIRVEDATARSDHPDER